MSKLRVGLVGAGGMADAHLPGLSEFADVTIAGFADVVPERAQAQAAKYGGEVYSSASQMIEEAGLDACWILLPPFAHGEAERACLEGKVPFLVEKPVGNDPGLIRELRDEVITQNLLTSAGYMNRYQPSVEQAKALLDQDEPVLAYGGWLGGPPTSDNEYMTTHFIGQWWVQKHLSGGQMVEQVTHTVDLVRYFLGEAVEVYAHSTKAFNHKLPNLMPNYTMDDAMTTTIRFANGGLASIMACSAAAVGGGVNLRILGTRTAAIFEGWGHDVTLIDGREGEPRTEQVASLKSIFPVEDRAFLDAVRSGDCSGIRTDYPDACQTSLLTLAANQSAATGQPVDLSN